jgi:hypothetical protein
LKLQYGINSLGLSQAWIPQKALADDWFLSAKTECSGDDAYFTEDAVENDKVVGQNIHKLGYQGGRWQANNYASADFRNLSGPLKAH